MKYNVGDYIILYQEKRRPSSGNIALYENKKYEIIFCNDELFTIRTEDGWGWSFLIAYDENQFKKVTWYDILNFL